MDMNNLHDTCEALVKAGKGRINSTWGEKFFRPLYSGVYLFWAFALGAVGYVNCGNNPVAYGSLFTFGLMLIILTQSCFLFTGDCLTLGAGMVLKRVPVGKSLLYLLICYVMNLVGGCMGAFLFGYCAKIFPEGSPAYQFVSNTAYAKAEVKDEFVLFASAIACNWLVSLAITLSAVAKTFVSKVVGIFVPICTFASIGYEHSIANSAILPYGMMLDSRVTFGGYWRNMSLVTLGNMVGAFVFMSLPLSWSLKLTSPKPIPETNQTAVTIEVPLAKA